MSRTRKSDFKFLRMWPREVFQHRNGKRLMIAGSEVLQQSGVYILYREDEPYYVGKATCLFERLHAHANKMTDRYYPLWTYFSAFAFDGDILNVVKRIDEIEGILIAAMPRVVNSSTPRWPKHKIPREIRATMKKAQGQRAMRSEERRVGKECRSRWSPY